jgi:hypothetical protein
VTTISLGPKSDCVYGRTGSTKTAQVGHLAEYIHNKYGKKTRLLSADPSGWVTVDYLVEAGLIEPYQVSLATKFPLEVVTKIAQGWWPVDPADPNSKLERSDEKMKGIGAYAFEGMSSFSILIMSNLLGRTDIHIPETPKESFVKDSELRWGFSGRAHYGFIQQRIYETVTTSNHLPVHKVLWSAHETDAKDQQKRQIYGPAIIGEALTGVCGAWFGALLHMQPISVEAEIDDPVNKGRKVKTFKQVPIMWLREHIDPNDPYKTPYIAKPRGPSMFWQEWPDTMEPNVRKLYEKLDEQTARAVAAVREKQKVSVAK